MVAPIEIFRALADEVRLRLVHAIMLSELSVAELVEVLGLPQSTVSRHLKPLREAGFLATRREGTSIYYRRGPLLEDSAFCSMLERHLAGLKTAEADSQAVRDALERRRARSREFFEKIAGRYEELTQPGGGWPALAAGLAAGFAGRVVADLGSGEGALAILLARHAKRVYAVDHSPAMLRLLTERAKADGLADRVLAVRGDLEQTTLEAESCDAVFLSQALHHAARPDHAIREAARILREGGQLIVLDLARHDHEWARTEWADQWLGFEPTELQAWMNNAGLDVYCLRRLDSASGQKQGELAVLLAVGTKRATRGSAILS